MAESEAAFWSHVCVIVIVVADVVPNKAVQLAGGGGDPQSDTALLWDCHHHRSGRPAPTARPRSDIFACIDCVVVGFNLRRLVPLLLSCGDAICSACTFE